jgi:hypothetical protein
VFIVKETKGNVKIRLLGWRLGTILMNNTIIILHNTYGDYVCLILTTTTHHGTIKRIVLIVRTYTIIMVREIFTIGLVPHNIYYYIQCSCISKVEIPVY